MSNLNFFQVMLLDSSLQLHPPALVILSALNALLVGLLRGSPSGEWVVGGVVVPCFIKHQLPPLFVGLAMLSLPGLRMQAVLPSHQH